MAAAFIEFVLDGYIPYSFYHIGKKFSIPPPHQNKNLTGRNHGPWKIAPLYLLGMVQVVGGYVFLVLCAKELLYLVVAVLFEKRAGKNIFCCLWWILPPPPLGINNEWYLIKKVPYKGLFKLSTQIFHLFPLAWQAKTCILNPFILKLGFNHSRF